MFSTATETLKKMQLNDFAIDTMDNKGRMSLLPIIVTESVNRESNFDAYLKTSKNPSSTNGP